MSWTVLKRTITTEGMLLEVAGSRVDTDGKPFNVRTVLIPLTDPTPDDPPQLSAQAIAALQIKGIAQIRQQFGDGDNVPAAPSRLSVVKQKASHPAVTHTGAVAAGATLAHLVGLIF